MWLVSYPDFTLCLGCGNVFLQSLILDDNTNQLSVSRKAVVVDVVNLLYVQFDIVLMRINAVCVTYKRFSRIFGTSAASWVAVISEGKVNDMKPVWSFEWGDNAIIYAQTADVVIRFFLTDDRSDAPYPGRDLIKNIMSLSGIAFWRNAQPAGLARRQPPYPAPGAYRPAEPAAAARPLHSRLEIERHRNSHSCRIVFEFSVMISICISCSVRDVPCAIYWRHKVWYKGWEDNECAWDRWYRYIGYALVREQRGCRPSIPAHHHMLLLLFGEVVRGRRHQMKIPS